MKKILMIILYLKFHCRTLGSVLIQTANAGMTGTSGSITMNTGTSSLGASGAVQVLTGLATSGPGGYIQLSVGAGDSG